MKQGEFELALGKNTLKLRCTPAALRTIEGKLGGIQSVLQKILAVEFSTIQAVIEAGLIGGLEYNKETLETEIFDEGVMNLIVPMVEYITLLGNGGKPQEKEPSEGED